ncbi:MAG: histidine phosphatase family protein [bacterium]
MRKVFLVRHPEIENPESRRFYGKTDIGLSQRGKIQAHESARRLAEEKIHLVYSSDLWRAHYPASLLARRLNIRHISLADLGEIHFGDWEGLTFEEIEESAPSLCQSWLALPDVFRFPAGESVEEFRRRVQKGYDFILGSSSPDQGNLAIITHGGVIRILLCGILGLDISKMWDIHLDFGAIHMVQYPPDDSKPPEVVALPV